MREPMVKPQIKPQSMSRHWRWLVAALSLTICLLWNAVSYAAIPSASLSGVAPVLGQISLPAPSGDSSRPPYGVTRYGAIEVAAVTLNGQELFKVVSPTVRDRSNPGKLIPVEVRAEEVRANLQRVIAVEQPSEIQQQRRYSTSFDPKTLQVETVSINGQTVITARDGYRTQPLTIVTVTELDGNYYGLTVAALAKQWRSMIYKRLSNELWERLPQQIEEQYNEAIKIGLLTVVASLLLWGIYQFLQSRDRILKVRQKAEKEAADLSGSNIVLSAADGQSGDAQHQLVLSGLSKRFTLQQRRKILATLKWLLSCGQVAIWLIGVAWVLKQFPATRQLGASIMGAPAQLVLIWFVAGLANWLADEVLDRFAQVWQDDELSAFRFFPIEDLQRKSLRISTAIQSLRWLKTFVIWFVGIAAALQTIGVSIASVLTGGAIVAFGVSLAFQNLVKDLINGCLIIWEDQYGLGDVVAISGSTGTVENMNLRITQIRDAEGRLITLPNSSITKVENLTRTWSRVNFEVEVDLETDVDQALKVISKVAQEFYQDLGWNSLMLEPPEVLGVDRLSSTGSLIRVWIKTQPSQQTRVGREFRRRVWYAMNLYGIRIGTPQETFRHEPDKDIPDAAEKEEIEKDSARNSRNNDTDDSSKPGLLVDKVEPAASQSKVELKDQALPTGDRPVPNPENQPDFFR